RSPGSSRKGREPRAGLHQGRPEHAILRCGYRRLRRAQPGEGPWMERKCSMSAPLTVDRHARIRSGLAMAERAACFAMASIRGRTAEVAARALDALRQKRQPE